MVTMDAKAFVDTNILLRAFHYTFPEHASVRGLFDQLLDEDYELWISRQVIREYLVQATHPRTFAEPLSIDSVLEQLEAIMEVCHIADDMGDVTTHLFSLLKTYPTLGKQIHDANVVATMLTYQIDTLITLNLDDFKRFEDKITLLTVPE
jgi:predicted nucleic acid-binding protein